MKSKTSCFNVTIFKKNLSHYWPIWTLFLCYLIVALPVNIWLQATSRSGYYENMTQLSKQYLVVSNVLQIAITPIPIFFASVIAAIAVFSYLFSAKNANMIHSLPVNRRELYITNFVSGLCFLLIPELIAFVTAVLVCLANQVTCIQYLFMWLLYMMGTTFFAYSLAVFVSMFTGLIFAVPVYFVIANYLYVGCLYIISLIVSLLCYGISDSWNPGASCILSPLYYLINNMRAKALYEDGTDQIIGVQVSGGNLVIIYAVAAVVIMLAAYQLYKRRKIETAGDVISIAILKPVFRWGVALCGGILVSVFLATSLKELHNINAYAWVVSGMVVFGFICFFAAEMLIQKNFKVFRKKKFIEWAAFTIVAVLFITLFKTDMFGIEKRIVNADKIESAFVYMDYPILVQGDDAVDELLQIQQQIIESKEQYLEAFRQEKYYYTTFRYYLKDGSVFERRYPLPIGEEYLKDASSPTARILAMEKEPELIKKQILGRNYAENQYYSGYMDLYSKDGNSKTYVFEKEEMEEIQKAVMQDIEAGNFDTTQIYSTQGKNPMTKVYFNGISLSYYNPENIFGNWDYYYNYREFVQNGEEMAMSSSSSGSCYINFGPECTNLIETLKKLGIVDDTWGLYTYDEYEENQK